MQGLSHPGLCGALPGFQDLFVGWSRKTSKGLFVHTLKIALAVFV